MVISRRTLLVTAAATTTTAAAAPKPLVLHIGPPIKGARSIEVSGKPNFPPQGVAYRENTDAHRVWRTIHGLAPSLVVDPTGNESLAKSLEGKVPVVTRLPKGAIALSPMARDRAVNMQRTPKQLAEQMARVFGHDLPTVTYIPAFACMGRVRLGALSDVERIVAPYVNGGQDSLAKASASHFSGHLLFAQLFEQTKNPAYLARVRAAADMAIATKAMNNEMSDGVFMGCPIMAQAGKLTGDAKYFSASVEHLRFMQKLCLRKDGVYRHSPLDEAAWGRGNAFPALGMALTLEAMGASADPHVLKSFRDLMAALRPLQDEDGLWHQVIDKPASYAEYSCTAMIGASMQMAIRNRWIDRSYGRTVDRAWAAILARSEPDGTLLDVCESTGKQKSETDYFHRAAVWGKDPRGGAMALLISATR